MKKIGLLALVIGLLGLMLTLGMDTTVQTSGSSRVHNLGLMSMQQNLLLVSIAVAFVGVVLLVFGSRKSKAPQSSIISERIENHQTDRACPFCAERIKAQAIVCRYCGRDVTPLPTAFDDDVAPALENENSPAAHKALKYLRSFENLINKACLWQKKHLAPKSDGNIIQISLSLISRHINLLGILLLVIGVVAFVHYAFFFDYSYVIEMKMPAWYASLHKFYRLEETTSIILSGLIIYFRDHLVKFNALSAMDFGTKSQMESNANKNFPSLFGIRIDFIVLQAVFVISIFLMHSDNELTMAYALAVAVLLIGYLLSKSDNKWYGIATGLIGVLYILYRHFLFNHLAYLMKSIEEISLRPPSFVNLWPLFWIIIISVAVPQLQLLKIGKLRYGGLRGDTNRIILGHEIFLPFGSALVFYILWEGISTAILIVRSLPSRFF